MPLVQGLATGLLLVVVVDGFRLLSKREAKNNAPVESDDPFADVPKCTLSKTSDCPLKDMTMVTLVYPDNDNFVCWNGDPWAFLVHPGKDNNNLLMYYSGGGAIFEDPNPEDPDAPEQSGGGLESLLEGLLACGLTSGMMNYSDPSNAVKDYSYIGSPSCTGGAHIANTTWQGSTGLHHQLDYSMNEVMRKWALHNFPDLNSLVISGSSAGSLGVAAWSDYLLKTFKYQKASVMLDSYMGVFPKDTAGQLMQIFKMCSLPPIASNDFLKKNCDAGTLEVWQMVDNAIASHPDVAFSVLNSKSDAVQLIFFGLIGDAFESPDSTILPSAYYKYVNKHLEWYNQYPNFVCYLVDGLDHVFLPRPEFYTTNPAGSGAWAPAFSTPLNKWIGQFVNHEEGMWSQCHGPRLNNGGSILTNYCSNKVFPKQLDLSGR